VNVRNTAPPSRRWFGPILAVCALAGLTIRLAYAIGWRFGNGLQYDGPIYRSRAAFLNAGRGFLDPDAWLFHHTALQSAIHPPLNSIWFALARTLGFRTDESLMVLGCLTGAVTIVVIGLAGRALVGPRVGLIAAGLAAVHAGFWSHDPMAMAETPAQLLTALALLLCIRFWKDPTPSRAGWIGVVAGLAALTRSELVVLLPGLVVPLTLAARGTTRQAVTRTGAAVLLGGLTLAPWAGWNLLRFEHPATLATGADISASYAQCMPTWYGPETGYFQALCAKQIKGDDLPDETVAGLDRRTAAGAFIRRHDDRLPAVVAARVGRTVGAFHPLQQTLLESNREPRDRGPLQIALVGWYLLVPLATIALVRPPVSRWALAMLLTPLGAGIAGAAATFGTSRYRSAGEVGLVLLAAVGIDVLTRCGALRRTGRSGEPAEAVVPKVTEART